MCVLFRYGVWDAFDVFFVAMKEFWTSTTNFVQAAEAVLRTISELKQGKHLSLSYEQLDHRIAIDAFQKVGINCAKSATDLEYHCTTS